MFVSKPISKPPRCQRKCNVRVVPVAIKSLLGRCIVYYCYYYQMNNAPLVCVCVFAGLVAPQLIAYEKVNLPIVRVVATIVVLNRVIFWVAHARSARLE